MKCFNDLKREERLRKRPLREGLMTLRTLCVIDNFDEVIAAEKVLDEAMKKFYRAHEDYHQILQTVEERQMSIIYLCDQVKLYQAFKERISRYLEMLETNSYTNCAWW